MAAGTVSALQKRGLRVPQDVSVMSIDGFNLAAIQEVPLTAVHVPRDELGSGRCISCSSACCARRRRTARYCCMARWWYAIRYGGSGRAKAIPPSSRRGCMTIRPAYPAPVCRGYSDPRGEAPLPAGFIVLAREIPRRGAFRGRFLLSARRRGSSRTSARPECTSHFPSPADFPPAPPSE